MPDFKTMIKGMEEKETPKAKNPNPAPAPKPQEVKTEQPKPQPKPSKEPMPFGMKKRMEDEVSVHNGQQPKGGQQMPKKDYSHLDDRELYVQMNLAENEEEYNDLLAEKERRWQESKKNQPQPKEDARFNSVQDKWEDEPTQEEAPLTGGNRLFNEYGIATKEGEKASADFKREKGIKNYYSLTNEQFNELAKEAMQKYGIKDLELAQEFLISNEESDRDWEKLPKQGSFKQAIKDMDKPEQDLGDFNPSEPIDDYQSGAKTHSENEFRIEALNDRGMYDFITKNRDYLYRKANSDPQGAVKDILGRASGNYSIKPENIRKDFVMDVLKSFYEDDEGQIPDFNKPEEFNPSDKIEEFDDYYGAKTASERNFNLMTGNDRGAYDYVTQNRDALAKEAEYDPASVLQKIKLHAQNRNWARELKPDSIRKDYLINVIKGIIED